MSHSHSRKWKAVSPYQATLQRSIVGRDVGFVLVLFISGLSMSGRPKSSVLPESSGCNRFSGNWETASAAATTRVVIRFLTTRVVSKRPEIQGRAQVQGADLCPDGVIDA